MTFTLVKNSQIPEGDFVAVAIKESSPQQNHVGLIYRLENDRPQLLHLAWHFDLRDEPLPESYYWAKAAFIEEFNTSFVAAFLSRIKNSAKAIPYGFDGINPSQRWFTEHGEYIKPPEGKGLTCATFVLAALRGRGYILLNHEEWPERPTDIAWQTTIINALATRATNEHIESLRNDLPAKRIRPEEVAACVAADTVPTTFASAEKLAAEIVTLISSQQ